MIITSALNKKQYFTPVSYTHLDVYKRQVKELDSKSNGLCPRRFESCPQRFNFLHSPEVFDVILTSCVVLIENLFMIFCIASSLKNFLHIIKDDFTLFITNTFDLAVSFNWTWNIRAIHVSKSNVNRRVITCFKHGIIFIVQVEN